MFDFDLPIRALAGAALALFLTPAVRPRGSRAFGAGWLEGSNLLQFVQRHVKS